MRLVRALGLLVPATLMAQQPPKAVAITFDDVPGVALAHCAGKRAVRLNETLLGTLERNDIPAAALVVTGAGRCGARDLTRIVNMWLDAGHIVGSHTHSHPDFNTTSLATYSDDVTRADELLNAALRRRGKTLQYFRYPGLHAGNTHAKKSGLDRFLASKRYRIAVVTIDNQEWVYAEAYAKAKARNDTARIKRILPAYFEHLDSSFAYYEDLTQRLFNRQIPQVLLLHANEINADHLEDVLRLIRRRGYGFVSLDQAMSDSAYRRPDTYIGPRGLSWLQRWALAAGVPFAQEPREHKWIR
jgi:peptidoglycan-N-acetylglucosamine deacetylase